jgi:hypothetical protein
MYTGNPEDDIDNITVADSVANLNEPPESDCRLYMVAEADGTYTLYVYPDLQPVRDGQDATFSLIGSDAGTSTAAEAPTASDIGLSQTTQDIMEMMGMKNRTLLYPRARTWLLCPCLQ